MVDASLPPEHAESADLDELFRQEAEGITERLDLLLSAGTAEASGEALRLAHTLKGLAVATSTHSLRDLARNLEQALVEHESEGGRPEAIRQAIDAARGLIAGERGAQAAAREASAALERRAEVRRSGAPWARRALLRRVNVQLGETLVHGAARLADLRQGRDSLPARLVVARQIELIGAALGLCGQASTSALTLQFAAFLSERVPAHGGFEAAQRALEVLATERDNDEVDGSLVPGVLRTVEALRVSVPRRQDEVREGFRVSFPWPDVDDPGDLLRALERQTAGQVILDARPRRVGSRELEGELGIAPQRRRKREEEGFVRVPRRRLDRLLRLAEQLVVAKAEARDLARKLQRLSASINEAPPELHRLARQARHHDRELDHLVRATQKGVLRARLVTARSFLGLVRMTVAEFLSRHPDREVDLELVGGAAEVDKGTLDALVEPVLHLVKNALLHGVESCEERLATGKPRAAKVRVAIKSGSVGVRIELSDDGRGLPQDEASPSGQILLLASSDEGPALAVNGEGREVTDDAGRGVGLLTALERVRSLRGRLALESTPGKGTTVRLVVPPAVGTARVLLIRSGSEYYALPLGEVESVVDVTGPEDAPPTAQTRVRLTALVGAPAQPERRRRAASAVHDRRKRDRFAVRLRPLLGDSRSTAPLPHAAGGLELIVDDVLRRDLVVVRPLGRRFARPGVAGAAVLGEGRLVLVLDPWQLFLSQQTPSSLGIRLPQREDTKP